MGNCGYRFFPRYKGAEEDYYETFYWLIKLANKYPNIKIGIKHHPGNYRPEYDKKEMTITNNTPLIYVNNQLNSYILASQAKMCVSYASIMILELNGFPQLAWYIRENRKRRRFLFKNPCKGSYIPRLQRAYFGMKNITYPPAYYLDPGHRNKHFCKNIDDICIHNCNNCAPTDIEIFEPYRICNYKDFERIALDKCI